MESYQGGQAGQGSAVPQPYYASQPGQAGQQGSAVPQPYYASQQGFGAPGGMPPQGFSQQPMMVAPQQMMGAAPMIMPMVAPLYPDTLATLVQVPGLFVKERVNFLEVLTGFEVENTFDVSLWNPQAGPPDEPEMGKGAPAFTMKEVSDCCQRQFCGHRRAFSIAMVPSTPMIGTYHPGLESRATMFSHPDALVFNRPFSWQCCCLCRPQVFVSHNTLGRFATISNPCKICAFHFDVHAATADDGGETPVSPTVAGENGAKWYTVSGTMCQPGAFCLCPCAPCRRIVLEVYDGKDVAMATPVGEIARVFPGCLQSLVSQASSYTISFPGGQHEHGLRRASLAAAVLLMNYLFAEEKKRRDNNNYNSNN